MTTELDLECRLCGAGELEVIDSGEHAQLVCCSSCNETWVFERGWRTKRHSAG